jgi:hypothetical protein
MMSRLSTFVLLTALTLCGCANVQPRYTDLTYCLVGSGAQCSELEGDGACQRCPTVSSLKVAQQ